MILQYSTCVNIGTILSATENAPETPHTFPAGPETLLCCHPTLAIPHCFSSLDGHPQSLDAGRLELTSMPSLALFVLKVTPPLHLQYT